MLVVLAFSMFWSLSEALLSLQLPSFTPWASSRPGRSAFQGLSNTCTDFLAFKAYCRPLATEAVIRFNLRMP